MLSPLRHVTNVISFAGKSTTFRMAEADFSTTRSKEKNFAFSKAYVGRLNKVYCPPV
ncbi:unnamed protein product [Acanthoscelides obtectus]|uniref:Uncharacterized protein n=1 Tax=Acanthoscelides obtectus TaxID=200917 RepID=A0A9P0MI00_ACAOB|nr:unnamed protein product [Acanthoscelides obtectus]CAK1659352.1 hypothetical protein AOBTE_LOCUS21421 [Acanthoscelides obtectus]